MGFVGNLVNKAKSYVPKIELPKVSLPNPVALAEKATSMVKDSFQAATKPLMDLASTIPSKVPQAIKDVKQGFADGINKAADKLGGELQQHGSTFEKAGKLLDSVGVPFAKDIQTLGKGAQVLGKGIADAPENAVALTNEIGERATNIANSAMDLLGEAKKFAADKVNAGIEGVKKGVEMLETGAKGLYEAGKEYVQGVADAVDYKQNIDKLGEGDKYKLGVGGSASVEGIKVYGKGSIEVEKKDGGYVVSVDGELGGGLYGEVGGKLGAKVNAEASATLGLGGKVEMKFATAEDAKKATEILLKQAAASAVQGQGPLGIPGAIASQAIKPSAEELKFLSNNVSAVEVRGNVAGELAGTLGIKDVAGINGSVKAKEEVAARIEFSNPPTVSIKTTLSGELAGSAGLRLTNGKEGAEGNTGGLPGASGKIEVKGSIEQKFTLPSNIDTSKLLADPSGYVKQVASQVVKSEQDKITLEMDASGGVLGSGGGAKTEVSFSAKAEDLKNADFMGKALRGDLEGALKSVGDKVEVEAKVTPYKTLGVSLAPGVSLMGFGAGVELEATRQDMAEQPAYQYKGTATDAATRLNRAYQQYSPYLNQGPVIIRG